MPTSIAYNSTHAIQIQSAGLFAANMQRNTTLNRLSGSLPQQADAENTLRRQSSVEKPIVRCMDLSKMAGDEVDFDLVNPLGGKPIMGSAMAEGRGRAMTFAKDTLRINQARYPVSAGDTMTQQRTPHQLRTLARTLAKAYMDRLSDQLLLVHLAGARGYHDNIEWAVPLASDADFAAIAINSVLAPTKNRHFLSSGSGIEAVSTSGGELAISSTDLLNTDVVDAVRTWLDTMPLPPSPIVFEGDQAASDSPIRVLLVSSEQYTHFAQSNQFRTFQSNALARAALARNHPIFLGDVGLWNGILIVKMPKPIRFYAGDTYSYCATVTSATETTTTIPAAFGTTYAVDRAILLGGQALCEAWGKNRTSGSPYFWNEEELDHKDKLEILVGTINGRKKVRFTIDHGSLGQQPTDMGVMAIDTAVRIAGV